MTTLPLICWGCNNYLALYYVTNENGRTIGPVAKRKGNLCVYLCAITALGRFFFFFNLHQNHTLLILAMVERGVPGGSVS